MAIGRDTKGMSGVGDMIKQGVPSACAWGMGEAEARSYAERPMKTYPTCNSIVCDSCISTLPQAAAAACVCLEHVPPASVKARRAPNCM